MNGKIDLSNSPEVLLYRRENMIMRTLEIKNKQAQETTKEILEIIHTVYSEYIGSDNEEILEELLCKIDSSIRKEMLFESDFNS